MNAPDRNAIGRVIRFASDRYAVSDHARRDVLDRLQRLVFHLLGLQCVGRRDPGDLDVSLVDERREDALHRPGDDRVGGGEMQHQRVRVLLDGRARVALLHLLQGGI
jgi:hypothetical protein